MIDDGNLIQEFVSEGREHLTAIEPDLLTLEKDGAQADSEVINRIFRAIHSIKGAAGFFGFENLKRLSHVMENVLMLMRDGKLVPGPEIISELLTGVDRLNVMFEDVQQSERVESGDLITRLEKLAAGESLPAGSGKNKDTQLESAVRPGYMPSDLEMEEVLKRGQRIYAISFVPQADLLARERMPSDVLQLLETLGSVLYISAEIENPDTAAAVLNGEAPLEFALASVLEADLLASALDVPEAQVNAYPAQKAENAVSETPAAPEATPGDQPAAASAEQAEKPRTTVVQESIETVRVRVDLLNNLMNLAGEMVLLRNQLMRTLKDDAQRVEGLNAILQNLNLTTTDLQEHIMYTRMQPIGTVFSRFRRVVRDLARQLDKEIELEIIGEDVELDKSLVEGLADPLTHLIRNCCDHGIETPAERRQAGKPDAGRIVLHAFHEGGQIHISIRDDGRGIDPARIGQKALKQGLVTAAELERMNEKDIINFIMLPGFSTAETVSDVSGRGVGMDVVRTNIEKLGGQISIESIKGQGTTMLLRLPLTLAIIPSLIVGVQSYRFAIPQLNLVELIYIKSSEVAQRIERVGSADVLRLRGKLLPLVRLSDVLGIERHYSDPGTGKEHVDNRQAIADRRWTPEHPELALAGAEVDSDRRVSGQDRRQPVEQDFFILILNLGANQYGLIVDQVLDLEEIVVKPLSGYLKHCQCFTAATIMGDGRVAMILDAMGIAHYAKLAFSELNAESSRREAMKEAEMEQARMEVILFNNAADEVFAIPLASVLRLEKFNLSDVQTVGEREFLPYRGKGLPLIRLEHYAPVKPFAPEGEEAYLIIPKQGDCEAGIVASRILDARSVAVKLQDLFNGEDGSVTGAAVLNGQMTLFLNTEGLLEKAGVAVEADGSTAMAMSS